MPIYFSDYKIEIFKNPAAYINSRGGHFYPIIIIYIYIYLVNDNI